MSSAVARLRLVSASLSLRPVAVDLFSGAGGLSLGLEQAGFDVVAAVEYDPVHAATHEYNFPHTSVLCADIGAPLSASLVRDAVEKGLAAHGRANWDGEIDLIAGGPPCQGFSLIGKRLVDDERNQLVFHFFRLISELQPRYFIMENVPGMLKGGHAGILAELIAEFREAGYRFSESNAFATLNAADFGVPQDRSRLFLMGTRADQAVVAAPPVPTHEPVPKRARADFVPSGRLPLGPTVAGALADLPAPERFVSLLDSDCVQLSASAYSQMVGARSEYARILSGEMDDPTDFSYERVWDPTILTGSMRTGHTDVSVQRFRATRPGATEPTSRFYRLDPMGLSNTLRAGSGSERGAFTSARPIHPSSPRVLTNREAARLHSFPDWFRTHSTKWHGFRQIGNAVAPMVGRAAAREVIRALAVSPSRPRNAIHLGDSRLLGLTMAGARSHFGVEQVGTPKGRTRGAVPGALSEPVSGPA